MALINSATDGSGLIVDTASKAARVTLYDAAGNVVVGQKTMVGSVPVVIASDQSAVKVDGSAVTQPISAAALPLPAGACTQTTLTAISAQLPATLGQKTMAASQAVAIASDQGAVPVSGPLTNAQLLSYSANLWMTATGAVNTSVTATLPAAGAGLFHYIISIKVTNLYSVVGVANGAGNIVTSTNLSGNPAWTTEQLASPAGTAVPVISETAVIPMKSAVANTATTIVCPAQLQTIWRVNVLYYTGP